MDHHLHALAEKIWNYHQMNHQLSKADAILVLCSHDKTVAETGAQLNTGENIFLTKRLLAERQLNPGKFMLVQKPYMERRSYATFKKLWPEKEVLVTSSRVGFDDYLNSSDYSTKTLVRKG